MILKYLIKNEIIANIISAINKIFLGLNLIVYICSEKKIHKADGYKMNPDVPLICKSKVILSLNHITIMKILKL